MVLTFHAQTNLSIFSHQVSLKSSYVDPMNPDNDIVIKRLHLYYDMKLVTFNIDRDKYLIIQFPVFIQPSTQQLLVLYQIEAVPVPIRSKHTGRIQHTSKDGHTMHCIKLSTVRQQELRTCKRIGYEFYCEELFVVKHKSKYSCKSTAHTLYFYLDPEIIK